MDKAPHNKVKASLVFGLALLVGIGAIIIYTVFDPAESALFPKCPFHALTGLDCPGCGSQRAIHALLQGHFQEALKANALFIAALPYLGLWIILEALSKICNSQASRRLQSSLYGSKAAIAVLVIIILFWIIRNITP